MSAITNIQNIIQNLREENQRLKKQIQNNILDKTLKITIIIYYIFLFCDGINNYYDFRSQCRKYDLWGDFLRIVFSPTTEYIVKDNLKVERWEETIVCNVNFMVHSYYFIVESYIFTILCIIILELLCKLFKKFKVFLIIIIFFPMYFIYIRKEHLTHLFLR